MNLRAALTSVPIWTLLGLAGECQVSLQRVTIASMPPTDHLGAFAPVDPPHPGVLLSAGRNRVLFDSWYGGTIRGWWTESDPMTYEQSIVTPHLGAAMNVIVDTGLDYTPSSANAFSKHLLATNDPATTPTADPYYIREDFAPPAGQTLLSDTYIVRGIGPLYWESFCFKEDAIPGEGAIPATPAGCSSGQPGTSGWVTRYLTPPAPTGGMVPAVNVAGSPVAFLASEQNPSGILMAANIHQRTDVGFLPWNQRLGKITEGRVAFKVKVDLREASADAIAGLMFRRSVPTVAGAGVDDAFFAPGYSLMLNQGGEVALHRADGSQSGLVHSFGAVAWPAVAAGPVELEIRTHNAIRERLDLFVDGSFVASYEDHLHQDGEHFGLYASADEGTHIVFTERQLFDVGMEFIAKYRGTADGHVEIDVTAQRVPGVATLVDLYATGIPGPQLNAFLRPELNTVALVDSEGRFPSSYLRAGNVAGLDQCAVSFVDTLPQNPSCGGSVLVLPIVGASAGSPLAIWLGDHRFEDGLFVQVLSAEIHDAPAPFAHASAGFDPGTPDNDPPPGMSVGISPLQWLGGGDECPPTAATRLRCVSLWGVDLVEPVVATDCDADGVADACIVDFAQIHVSNTAAACQNGTTQFPFSEIEKAAAVVDSGGVLRIEGGTYDESLELDRPVRLESTGGTVVITGSPGP